MGWLSKIRGEAGASTHAMEGDEGAAPPSSVTRASPGLTALFDLMKAEGRHSILDLGEGTNRQMEALAPYACLIRFVGLVPVRDGELRADPTALPAHPENPYDVVLAWDVLDTLSPEARAALVRRLDEITRPGARIYASVLATPAETIQPVRSTLLEPGRVVEEPVGRAKRAAPHLLPAQMEKLLSPWVVSHAYSLRTGRREYVARKDAQPVF